MKQRMRQKPPAVFFVAAAAFTLGAATLLFAQSDTGDYSQRNLGSLAQPMVHAAEMGPKYSVGSYPLYWPELEPGEGRELVSGYCNACHSPRYIPMQPPLTHDQWAAEVTKMLKTFGIAIPDSDQTTIINYLAAHYSPETRKK